MEPNRQEVSEPNFDEAGLTDRGDFPLDRHACMRLRLPLISQRTPCPSAILTAPLFPGRFPPKPLVLGPSVSNRSRSPLRCHGRLINKCDYQ